MKIPLLLLLLAPLAMSAQNIQYNNGQIEITKSFRVDGKSDRQLYSDLRSAISREYDLYRVIATDDTTNNIIMAFGKVDYGEKTPKNLNREASFRIWCKVSGDVYTIRFHDFSGKLKNRANSQYDYNKEYESLFVFESSAKRKPRINHFNNFEGAIMESMSNITSRVGVTELVRNTP